MALISSAMEIGSVGFGAGSVVEFISFGPQAVVFRMGSLTPDVLCGELYGGAFVREAEGSWATRFDACGIGNWFG